MSTTSQANQNKPLLDPEDENQRRIVYVLTTELAKARLDRSLSGKYNKSARKENLTRKMEALATGNGTALMKDQVELTTVDLECQLRFPLSQLATKGGRIEKDLREILDPAQRRKIAGLTGHITKVGVVGQGHNTPFTQLLFELDCAQATAEFMSKNPSLPVGKTLATQKRGAQAVTPALGAWEAGTYFGYCPQANIRKELNELCHKVTEISFDDLFPGITERINKRRESVADALLQTGRFDYELPDIWYTCGTDMDSHIETWGSGLTEGVLRNGVVLGNTKENCSFVLAHSLLGSYLLRDTARNFLVYPGQPELVDAKDPSDPNKTIEVPVLPESVSYFLFAPNRAIDEAISALTRPQSVHAQLMKATYRSVESIRLSMHCGEAQSDVYKRSEDGLIAFMFDGRPVFSLPENYECVFNLKIRVTVSRNRIVTHSNEYTDRLVISANPFMHNSWPQAVFPQSALLNKDRPNVMLGTPSLVYTQAQLSQYKSESLGIMASLASKRKKAVEAGQEISSAFDDNVRLAHEYAEQTGQIYQGDLRNSSSGSAASSSSSSPWSVPAEDD